MRCVRVSSQCARHVHSRVAVWLSGVWRWLQRREADEGDYAHRPVPVSRAADRVDVASMGVTQMCARAASDGLGAAAAFVYGCCMEHADAAPRGGYAHMWLALALHVYACRRRLGNAGDPLTPPRGAPADLESWVGCADRRRAVCAVWTSTLTPLKLCLSTDSCDFVRFITFGRQGRCSPSSSSLLPCRCDLLAMLELCPLSSWWSQSTQQPQPSCRP